MHALLAMNMLAINSLFAVDVNTRPNITYFHGKQVDTKFNKYQNNVLH